jgi:hypothetical protein
MAEDGVKVTSQILKTLEILERLEELLDIAPDAVIESILLEAWSKVSDTFPEDFQEATRHDAGAEGLRRYLRVKLFFENPSEQVINQNDLTAYYQNRVLPIDDCAEFFFRSD